MSVRAERAAVALRLRAEGKTGRQIAEALGVSRSYAAALYTDPDRSKDIARKASYGGVCSDCGSPTDGSNGRALAAKRCSPCQHAWEIATKKWTREAVIDAIRRFAAENGRPPTATEWIRANPAKGYPARTSCYVSSAARVGSPFATWGDAIVAAGFPRPERGRHERTPEMRARQSEGQLRRYERERQAA